MKRFTALLLLVLLAIAPFSASRAANGHPDEVLIWGKTLNSSTPYYHNGDNGSQGTVDGNSQIATHTTTRQQACSR